MRRIKILVATTIMAFSSLVAVAAPANAVVCHEDINSCCEDPVILGKEYNLWDCMT
jgi:hypothetical protein